MLRLLLGFALLAGCTSPPPPTPVAVEEELPVEKPSPRVLAEDPLYTMAKRFDDLVRGKLSPSDATELERLCEKDPQKSLFCHGVLNRTRLIAQTLEASRAMSTKRYRGRPYRAQFSAKNQVLNWNEIRKAPVQGLLRGMPKNSLPKMQALKALAMRETECPNFAAVAVAASLEDQLPETVSFDEIGRLYEKAAACAESNSAERENLTTRAGLFYFAESQFDLAQNLFLQASAIEGAFTGRALYWLIRTQTQLGQTRAASATLEKLKTKYPFSFHTLVALTAAERDPGELLDHASVHAMKRSKMVSDANALIEQAEELKRLGFDTTASKVLDWAAALPKGSTEPEVLVYIAELKKELGDYRSKIAILSNVLYQNPELISRDTLQLYFPKVLFTAFEKQAQTIDPYFLISIARRESAFNSRAISSANARGLLQILPQTGRRLMKRPNLFDPETNITVGARYITELLEQNQGQAHLALASYNAGPVRVKSWLKNYPVSDPVLFTDLIPFRETREYVSSVLRNYYWYRRIHQGNVPIAQANLLQLATVQIP